MQAIANIGSSETNQKDVNITFPQPFGTIPPEIKSEIMVNATIILDTEHYPLDSYTDNYAVSVGNITLTGFTARVTRLNSDSGWGMELKLAYSANYTTIYN